MLEKFLTAEVLEYGFPPKASERAEVLKPTLRDIVGDR
jgi:hypothetical protein